MSERTCTNEQLTAVDRSVSELTPSVRTIATDSMPPRDQSLAVALCVVAGDVGAHPDDARQQADRLLEPITNAVAVFEGYVRIRRALLTSDRYDRPSTRDAAVLASDSLHATAYTMVADAPVSDRRTLELYRILTEGSSALAAAFQARSGADAGPSLTDDPRADAILGGIASELGATAVGATGDVRTALGQYGRSLLAALAAHPSTTDGPRETATLLLAGRLEREAADATADTEAADAIADSIDRGRERVDHGTAALEGHLERARNALASLEASDGGSASDDSADRSPIARLERTTRIPFEDVLSDDG